jgi:N-acetylmuramoyl-L-alanine amidase
MFGSNSLLRSWPCQFLTTLLLIAGLSVSAAPPIWWTTPDDANFRVIDPSVADSNPFGPANVGQSKYVAKRAFEALSAAIGDNAVVQSQVVAAIEQELYKSEENSPTGVFYPVVPDEPTPEWLDAQKVPLQIGAMKAMAAPFYRHLSAMNANWVRNQLMANGLTLGSGFFQDSDGAYYPWNPADNSSNLKNRAPATIGQLKVVFSLRFEVLDTDGDGIVDSADQNGDGVPDSAQDSDRDGLTDAQEYALGTDTKKADTDEDGLADGDDAEPKDSEINWERTPETPYVWVEQVDEIDVDHQPRAVNRQGQILFHTDTTSGYDPAIYEKALWNSATKAWVNLAPRGSQAVEVQLNSATSSQTLAAPVVEFIDINDNGTVFAVTEHDNYFVDPAGISEPSDLMSYGMVWKRSGAAFDQYATPTYFFKDATVDLGQIPTMKPDATGAIANDGSINASFGYGTLSPSASHTGWYIHDSKSEGVDSDLVKVFDHGYSHSNDKIHVGSILDKDRALFSETRGSAQSGQQCSLWLKEGGSQTDLSFMTPQPIGLAEMSLAPNLKNDQKERLWITTGTSAFLEMRAGGTGAGRWHTPPSMSEEAIRMNARGEAITATKLWRNGKYTDLNDDKLTTKPTDVEITEAIDLASNGIILVQAKKGTVRKTGLLLPVEVVELAPKVMGEDGKEIVGSVIPVIFPKSNEMVEVTTLKEQVEQNRIAHREMKVKIPGGKVLAGKKAIWTMKAWGVKENDALRGDWKHSKVEAHKNCFEESKTYGKYDYKLIDQKSSETIIGAEGEDGFTAVRANLPPFGWNHADIKVKIDGAETEITIARFVVPAVVVIDAGHGGDNDIGEKSRDDNGLLRGRSDANHAKGGWWNVQKTVNGKKVWVEEKVYPEATGILEKDLTLEYARELKSQLASEHTDTSLPLRHYLTRNSDDNLGGYERARLARDKGADICMALHFNASSDNKTARGSLVCTRTSLNCNLKEDKTLETNIAGPVNDALRAIDNAERNNTYPFEMGTAVTSDILGFYQDKKYHPIRSTLLEIEFIHSEGGDKLINGANKDQARKDSMKSLARALIKSQKDFVVEDD